MAAALGFNVPTRIHTENFKTSIIGAFDLAFFINAGDKSKG
jgi:hypothetical protein